VIIDEYFDDLGVAYRAEIEELYELGCRKPTLIIHILEGDEIILFREHSDRRPHFLLFLRREDDRRHG
jgi:hypothetical protein